MKEDERGEVFGMSGAEVKCTQDLERGARN